MLFQKIEGAIWVVPTRFRPVKDFVDSGEDLDGGSGFFRD
jgi:hypothetical protein